MKLVDMCRKFECREDIHYKTQTGTSCEKCKGLSRHFDIERGLCRHLRKDRDMYHMSRIVPQIVNSHWILMTMIYHQKPIFTFSWEVTGFSRRWHEDQKPKYWRLGAPPSWNITTSNSIQDGDDLVVNALVFDLRVQLQHCTYQRKTLLFTLTKVSTFIRKREISGFSSTLRKCYFNLT